jgi:arylsulfatase A-like enzyme
MQLLANTRRSLQGLKLLAVCAGLIFAGTVDGHAAETRPNIIVILADDLGWSDLACYGADLHQTPNLDRLAADGVRFTDAYAGSSVCTPTRAALMTGRHPARLGMTIWAEATEEPPKPERLIPPPAEHNLPLSETTIAEHLQAAGYQTALVGKWHLGDPKHYPEAQGFNINIGGTLWGAPQTFFYPYSGSGLYGQEFRYVPHLEFGAPGEYLTDRLTDEALKVIDRCGEQPFFLYLAHHAPHTPIEAKEAEVAMFQRQLTPSLHHQNAAYAAMIKSLDESVGRIREHLNKRGLAERTLIIFTSDNGGFVGKERGRSMPVTSNWPLRSGKGALYEGGIRVPLLVSWSGVTPAGKECHEPVVTMDLFVSMLAAAGIKTQQSVALDGLSLLPVLKDPSGKLDRDALYFHYPHYYHSTSPVSAIRMGDQKLVEFYEDGRTELYNLRSDIGELRDLASSQPQAAAELKQRLHDWRQNVGARLPTTNPNYQPRSPKPRGKGGA